MNYSEIVSGGREKLSRAGISEAALDARLLLEFLTGKSQSDILSHPETVMDAGEVQKYDALIEKRAMHVPLSYLTGMCCFMGIDFFVTPDVLIPRQDSECLVEEAMRYVNDGDSILDMCTGSGCLLLSLMHYKNGCMGTGVDISEGAVAVAEKNLKTLEEAGMLNGGTARILCGDMFAPLDPGDKYDCIISNPPYIRTEVYETLMPEVHDHEPRTALDAGSDGLMFYRKIAKAAPGFLSREGRLFLEIGYDQADEVSEILKGSGFTGIDVYKDYAGNDRVVIAKR